MADQYIGEIRIFAGTFAPPDWAFCDGQLILIQDNTALFSIIGTTYGGNGVTTFALPNLNGRVPIGADQGPGLSNRVLGSTGGTPAVALRVSELPEHGHGLRGTDSPATFTGPQSHAFAAAPDGRPSYGGNPGTAMNAGVVGSAGGGQPHNNEQPYLPLNFIIALQGVYPPRG